VGTHDGALSAFEVYVELLRPDDLVDDMEFWQIDERFNTIDIIGFNQS
jgi:hypothetical protein